MSDSIQFFDYNSDSVDGQLLIPSFRASLLDDMHKSFFMMNFVETICAAIAGAVQLFVTLKVRGMLAFFPFF